MSARWLVRVALGYRHSRHDEPSPPYTEALSDLRLDLTRGLQHGWQIRGGLRFAENEATQPSFSYEQRVLSIALRKVL